MYAVDLFYALGGRTDAIRLAQRGGRPNWRNKLAAHLFLFEWQGAAKSSKLTEAALGP